MGIEIINPITPVPAAQSARRKDVIPGATKRDAEWSGQPRTTIHSCTNPLVEDPMARKRMFKQIGLTKLEALGSAGSWAPIAKLVKSQDQLTSAYVDSVRISFILEGDTSGSTDKQLGYLFCATTKGTLSGTDSSNTPYIISGSASRGGGGVVTLPIKRRIVDNDYDDNSGQGAVSIQCRMTDTGTESYDITMIVEAFGRWHDVETA